MNRYHGREVVDIDVVFNSNLKDSKVIKKSYHDESTRTYQACRTFVTLSATENSS